MLTKLRCVDKLFWVAIHSIVFLQIDSAFSQLQSMNKLFYFFPTPQAVSNNERGKEDQSNEIEDEAASLISSPGRPWPILCGLHLLDDVCIYCGLLI